jgi:hypothetical protein
MEGIAALGLISYIGCTYRIGAARIIGTLQKFCGHKNAAKEAAAQEIIISSIGEFA